MATMERKKCRLGDLIEEYISGDWGYDVMSEEAPNGVFCIRGADIVPITNSDYSNIPLRYISNRSKNKRLLKAGDLVIEKSGGSPTQSTGRMVIVSEDLIREKKQVVCSNFCTAIRLKAEWNPLYVYYFWSLAYNSGVFFNFEGKTSGLRNLNLDLALSSIEIKKSTTDEQDKLVRLLSDLDRKISLNRRMNATLEAMARQLYDYWFVQFDFPNHEGKPYKSSGGKMVWNDRLKREIPEGWEIANICLIADVLSGGTPSKAVAEYWDNGDIPFFGPTDYNGSMFQIETSDHITEAGLEHCASTLFKEGDVFITARGSIGKLVIVGTQMAMNQSCYALRSKNGRFEYLYFLTIQLIECLKAKGSGSVFKSITLSDIENSLLCISTPDVVEAFCKIASPLVQRIKENTKSISSLTHLRTTLLPLLLNGQVEVGAI